MQHVTCPLQLTTECVGSLSASKHFVFSFHSSSENQILLAGIDDRHTGENFPEAELSSASFDSLVSKHASISRYIIGELETIKVCPIYKMDMMAVKREALIVI